MKVNNKATHSLMNDRAIQDIAKDPSMKRAKNQGASSAEMMDATKINLSTQARQIGKAKEIASQEESNSIQSESDVVLIEDCLDSDDDFLA